MRRHALISIGFALVCCCTATAKDEPFAFVDLKTGNPISNATVEICVFATDISYDAPHLDLISAVYRTDDRGIARIDMAKVPVGWAVLHISGYVADHITYSPVLAKLAMPGDVRGHIRVVRIEDYSRPILGNSIYDLDARREYFVDVKGAITTNRLETVKIQMKKSEPPAPDYRRDAAPQPEH